MHGSGGSDLSPVPGILTALGTAAVVLFLLYLYFSITLMVIARKTGTRSAWLAWIPVANLFLMCQAGRRPAWWGLLLLVPGVNVLVGVMVWISIAEARGRLAWTGALILVPVLGLLVPAYLASGAAPAAAAEAAGLQTCPACRAAAPTGDTFCGECGKPLPTATGPRPASSQMPAGRLAALAAAMIALIASLAGGGGWIFMGRALAYTPPARKPPAMPSRLAGSMTEFPVDTDPRAPTRPGSVVAQSLEPSGSGAAPSVQVPQKWLPPGLKRESLPRRARTVTAATYRARRTDKPVTVAVLGGVPGGATGQPTRRKKPKASSRETPREVGGAIAGEVAAAAGAKPSGVRVQNPEGEIYLGWRIRSAQVTVYILDKQGADFIIIVYAPDPAAAPVAERLASNVGNGEGLNDDPAIQGSLWSLPASPPSGLVLQETHTLASDDLGLSEAELQRASGEAQTEEARRMVASVRQLAPERLTLAHYTDRSGRDWGVLEGDYGSPRRAWCTWVMARWALSLTRTPRVPLRGTDGWVVDIESGRLLLFQRGPYLVVLVAPARSPLEQLSAFGNSFQI